MSQDFANSFRSARSINSNTSLRNSIGGKDKLDVLRFKLDGCSNVSISLSRFNKSLALTLLNSNKGFLSSSVRDSKRSKSINTQLDSGEFFLRVSRTGDSTQYQLRLTSTPCPVTEPTTLTSTQTPFNAVYGYGLVNAAAAVARAIGQTAPFPDVNTQDYFAPNPNLDQWIWGLDAVNAPEAWAQGYTGQGVVVAVIDSGIDNSNARLSPNLWTNRNEIPFNSIDDDRNGYVDDVDGWDFVNNDNTPIDIHSHGTFVAGIIADTASGIARQSTIMPIKVASTKTALDVDIAAGIYYATQNGAKIINISYGGLEGPAPELQQALQFARQNNVLVVLSAGNSGQQSVVQPDPMALFAATRDYGIVVGATDRGGRFADFSSPAGDRPIDYVVAPGVDVYSDSFDADFNPTFVSDSGTSFSAPAVAGIAALMLSANPQLVPSQIEQILTETASQSVWV